MKLNSEQQRRYQAILTSLVGYVDGRLHLTRRLPPSEEERLAGERMAVIVRELWRNPVLIGDFARENPDGLDTSDLEVAQSWRHGICCRCAIAGVDARGNYAVETSVGRFSVCGIDIDPGDQALPTPVHFKTALLPFDDLIVFGHPINDVRAVDAGELAWMRDRAAAAGFTEPVITADDLLARSAQAADVLLDDELGLLEDSSTQALPRGFHRGTLADEGEAVRMAASREALAEYLREPSDTELIEVVGELAGVPGGTDASAVREVLRALEACAVLYGIVALMDAYDQYVSVSDAPLSRGRFETIAQAGACLPPYSFDLWVHEGVAYVIVISCSEAMAAITVLGALDGRERSRMDDDEAAEIPDDAFVLDDRALDGLDALVREEAEMAQARCRSLLALQASHPRRPLERRMVVDGVMWYLMRLDAVVALRDYLDAHVPDGQDDATFADVMAFDLVRELLPGDASVEDGYRLLARANMMRCEGSDWSHSLGRMVVNVFNTLPFWQHAGWSLRQFTDRLTGRWTFYARDGTPMKLEGDDPCPCGSGRRYGTCCGRQGPIDRTSRAMPVAY